MVRQAFWAVLERTGGLHRRRRGWMPHRQAFAGSIATFDRLVRTMLEAGVPLLEVIRMASETPAKIIGCHRKGTLDVGKDADIVLFDDNIRVVRTIVRGKTVFSK